MEDLKRQTYMLLLNMLPEHVADHFLRRAPDSDDLYSQSYDCTSVIFASIPGFSKYFQDVEQIDGQVSPRLGQKLRSKSFCRVQSF